MSRMTRFSRPEGVLTIVSSFHNHANFSAVTKPQSTFLRHSESYLILHWETHKNEQITCKSTCIAQEMVQIQIRLAPSTFLLGVADLKRARFVPPPPLGIPYMTSAKFWDFFYPPPPLCPNLMYCLFWGNF